MKNYPTDRVIDTLNQIEDIKTISFILVSSKGLKLRELFLGLDFEIQSSILVEARDSELRVMMKDLWPDDILELMHTHEESVKRILLSVDSKTRAEIKKISNYDEEEIGSIMNPKILTLDESWTLTKCLSVLRKERVNFETINELYVTNKNGILVGKIKLQDIIFANHYSTKLSTITDNSVISINAKDDIEDVINMFAKYSIEKIAVCNDKNILIGYIKDQDILDAIQDEVTEDIYNMYGIKELSFPYLYAPIWSIVKSRLLWLIILMIAATLTSIVLDLFQGLGEQLTSGLSTLLLIPILPVLTGTSGNAGSQASASIIRSLSTGELTKKEYTKAVSKETLVGFVVGSLLALINFARLLIYFAAINNTNLLEKPKLPGEFFDADYSYQIRSIIAAASSLTLLVAIVFSKTIGAILPILATKMRIDPTVMSAPILATVLDVSTTTLLFGIGLGILQIPGVII